MPRVATHQLPEKIIKKLVFWFIFSEFYYYIILQNPISTTSLSVYKYMYPTLPIRQHIALHWWTGHINLTTIILWIQTVLYLQLYLSCLYLCLMPQKVPVFLFVFHLVIKHKYVFVFGSVSLYLSSPWSS